MADKRRLQAEIDRSHKKVQEGCEIFDDIWEKFNTSNQINQKEKFEADLKREIKKLQRLRDQIKSWLNTSEIRDKSPLLDDRKKIETRMERFKVVEKETKTKAYSKEGLGASAKLDPAAREKREMEGWLQDCINSLELQVDQTESELEGLATSGGKKKNKADKQKEEKKNELNTALERHRFHIKNLETLLRMLNNDAVDVKQIKEIQEDVQYYVDSNTDDDFEENQYIYDDLNLDEQETDFVVQPVVAHADSNHHEHDNHQANHSTTTNSSSSHVNAKEEVTASTDNRSRHRSSTNSDEGKSNNFTATHSKPTVTVSQTRNSSATVTSQANSDSISVTSSTGSSVPSTPITTQAPGSVTSSPFSAAVSAAPTSSSSGTMPTTTAIPVSLAVTVPSSPVHPQLISYSNAAASPSANDQAMPNAVTRPVDVRSTVSTPPQSSTPNSVTGSSLANSVSNSSIPSPAPSPSNTAGSDHTPAKSSTSSISLQQQQPQLPLPATAPPPAVYQNGPPLINGINSMPKSEGMTSLRMMAQSAIVSQMNPPPPSSPALDGSLNKPLSLGLGQNLSPTGTSSTQPSQTSSIRLSPLLGVAPLGPKKLTKENHQQADMLMAAFQHMPHPSDSERLRHYLPRNPFQTPSYYPQTQPVQNDTVEFFQRLSTEALFFIFYYMEGTKAQYLAAKALKKQSWRFHTKYMMWFQRHDEPRSITDECEQGTYIYFDYEKWGQRRKEGFTFEYRFLEDRDLN